uniref:C2H2-type domain-containing protein n=2 Tax=Magallana gigas TaxID=29159 RepID=A0A8W8JIY7_MAGGI
MRMSSREFPLNMAEGRSADKGDMDQGRQRSGSSNANKNDISCYSDVIKNLLSITNKSQQESKKRYKLVVLRPKHPGDKLMVPCPKQPCDPQQSGSNVATDHNRFLQQVETATPSNIGPLDTSNFYISQNIKTEDDSDWIGLNESPSLCTSTATDKTSIPQMTKTENDVANESVISQNIKTEDIIINSDLTGHNQSTSPALCTPIVSTVIKTENDKDVISDARLTGWNESKVNTSHSVNSQMLSGSKCSSTMINTENDFRIFGTSLADQHRIPYFSLEPSLSHVVKNETNLTITNSSLESLHMSVGNAHCQNDSLSSKKRYTSILLPKDSPSTPIHTVYQCPVSLNPVKSWSDIKGVIDRTSSRKRHIAPQQSASKETQSSVDMSKEEDEEESINKFLEMSGKFFKCGFCDEAFAEAEELNWHLREHSSFNRMQPEKRQKPCQEFKGSLITEACPICLKQTPCEDLGLHCKSHGVMLTEIMFNCEKCSTLFNSSQRLNVCVHLENNKEALQRSLSYRCSVCRENYEEISAFKEHMQAHKIPERARALAIYTCPICDKLFSNQSLLKKHRKNGCSQKVAKTCRFCGQFYQRNFESPSSIGTNNGCIKCRKFLKLKISLRKQMSTQKIHRCPVCSRCFSRIFLMKSHVRNNHIQEVKQKGFKCFICGKVFRSLGNIGLHMNSHVPVRSLPCLLCRKKFSNGLHLKLHMKIHSSEMFYCKICYKRFYNANHFFRHRAMNPIDCNCEGYASNTKHGASCVKVRVFFKAGNSYILDVCKESSLHACKICSAQFESVMHLQHHLKTKHEMIRSIHALLSRKT